MHIYTHMKDKDSSDWLNSTDDQDGIDPLKSTSVKSFQWERINMQKPIWMRPPREVNSSEYFEFYKTTFKSYDEPSCYSHFALEGQVDFKALLYIPTVVRMAESSMRDTHIYIGIHTTTHYHTHTSAPCIHSRER
jgi:HSP90 family molecular chaperone